MKKIAYLVNTFLRPSERFIYDQVVNIRNFSVEVLTRTYANRALYPYDKVYTLTGIEKYRYVFTRTAPTFKKIVINHSIGLIHAHFGVEGVYALPLKKSTGLPLIVTIHGQDITRLPKPTLYPPAWLNYWFHYKELQREGDLFLGVSEYISRRMIEKGFPKERVKTHYLGIDLNVPASKRQNTKSVMTAGRLVEKKGTEYLIRAMAEVQKSEKNAVLRICGDGPLRGRLEKLAETLGLSSSVEFLGWRTKDEMNRLFGEATVFVLPSVTAEDGDAEGLGMVILEAMARSLPVIGTEHGGIPDAVINNETGFLVPEKDHIALSVKIKMILSDKALAERMGSRGRELVEEKFNIERQIQKLEELYREYL